MLTLRQMAAAPIQKMMFERIKESRDLNGLRVGDLLIQYPLAGPHQEIIDLTIADQYMVYQVTALGPVKLRLLLCRDIAQLGPAGLDKTEEEIAEDAATFITKLGESLPREKTWWRFRGTGYK